MPAKQIAFQAHSCSDMQRYAKEGFVNQVMMLGLGEDEAYLIVRIGFEKDIIVELIQLALEVEKELTAEWVARIYEWNLRIPIDRKISYIINLPVNEFIVEYCTMID